MNKKFRFTIITAIYNSQKYLKESIESVINQNIGFEDNVQLILVDDGSRDKSKEIAISYQKQYPNNILVLSKQNEGVASARNLGLKYANGEFINFLDSDDKLTYDSLKVVNDFLLSNDIDIVAIPLKFFGRREGDHYLNYKFEKSGIIDLNENYDYPHAHISSTFIKSTLFKNYHFNTNLINGSDLLLMNEILIDVKKYGVVNKTHYNYRKRNDETSIMDNASKSKRFFTEKMKLIYKHLINSSISKEGYVLKFIQYLIALDINGIIVSPNYENIFSNSNEKKEFWNCLHYILGYIDEDIIKNHRYLSNDIKLFYNYLKNNEDFHVVARPNKNKLFLKSNDFIINKVHNHRLHLTAIHLHDNFFNITGYFASNCKNETIKIKAILRNTDFDDEIVAEHIDERLCNKKTKKFLSIDWKFYYNFNLKIPVKNSDFKVELIVDFSEDNNEVRLYPKINLKEESKLYFKNNSLINDSKSILFKENFFYIFDNTIKNKIKFKLNRF